jgi:hypothetical protein
LVTKSKPKPVLPDVEISTPLVPDNKWTFKFNDEPVTFEQHKQIMKDHEQWTKEQEKAIIVVDDIPKKRKRK